MTNPSPPRPPSLATIAAHAGGAHHASSGGVVPALAPAVTFARDQHHQLPAGRMYLRDDNENGEHVEKLLATLEGGQHAKVFASGLAAAVAVFMATLRPGDAVVATRVMYFGVRHWLTGFCERFGMQLVLVDGTSAGALATAIATHKPRLLWLETPGNPTLDVVDIAAAAQAAHAVAALVVVDSTAATPVHTQPLALGADIVMHSATKYLNGHHDVLAGALVVAAGRGALVDDAWRAIGLHRKETGAVLGPFEAWLLLRGLRTLALRVERQSASALRIALWLAARTDVVEVLYPGLPSHKNHDVALRQMHGGFGGLLAFRLGSEARALQVASAMKVFLRATSLGGVESFVEHRATVEGPETPTPRDLLRLAIGIEDPRDLVDDLAQALAA